MPADPAVLDGDLLRFERGDQRAREAVVDGVRRSMATGFVTTSHDLPLDLLDEDYGLLEQFFQLPQPQKPMLDSSASPEPSQTIRASLPRSIYRPIGTAMKIGSSA